MLNLKPLTLIPHIFVIKLGFVISDQCSGQPKPKNNIQLLPNLGVFGNGPNISIPH
jgi:hypothetical protein